MHLCDLGPKEAVIPQDAPRHPFLTRVEVAPDGRRRVAVRVFCPRTGGTAPIEACESCEHAVAVEHTGHGQGWVICAVHAEAAGLPAPAPRHTVAEVARHGVTSVEDGVPERVVWELLGQEGARLLAVVDDLGACRGWIRPSHRLAHLGQTSLVTAGALVASAVTIEETAPADMALRQMATSRLREIVVVSVDHEPVALLTDVDALRIVAGQRHRGR